MVLLELKAIFDKAGTVVGHALENEQQYLRGLPWSHWSLRDTQRFSGFAKYAGNPSHPRPGLKMLALSVAGIKIQEKVHCSVQDARATRKIYSIHSDGIEKEQSEAVFQAKLLYTNFPREYKPATDPTAKYLVVDKDLTEQMKNLTIEPQALSSSMPTSKANEGTDEIEAKLWTTSGGIRSRSPSSTSQLHSEPIRMDIPRTSATAPRQSEIYGAKTVEK